MPSPPRPSLSQLIALANAGQPLPVGVAADLAAARAALHQVPPGNHEAFLSWASTYLRSGPVYN